MKRSCSAVAPMIPRRCAPRSNWASPTICCASPAACRRAPTTWSRRRSRRSACAGWSARSTSSRAARRTSDERSPAVGSSACRAIHSVARSPSCSSGGASSTDSAGCPFRKPPHLAGTLAAPLHAGGDRPLYQPARWQITDDGRITVDPLPWRGSGDPFGLAGGNALVVVPRNEPARKTGESVTIVPLELPQ